MAGQKLELLLTTQDKMSPPIKRLIVLFRELRKETGKTVTGLNHVSQQLGKPIASAGVNKLRSDVRGLTRDVNLSALAFGRMQKRAAAPVKARNTASSSGSQRSESFVDDAAFAGAGAAGLLLSKTGIGAAMSKQEALTDLQNSFYRSSLGAADFNEQMRAGEQIADKLGSKLKGNTSDYLNLLSVMRQRGIDTKTILEGAGEAAAYLSVANRSERISTGENLAQFGQLFDLKGKEYVGAADLLSRIKTSKGLESDELIEGLKYFGGRTATSLNLTGAKGAEDSTRYLAFLRQKTALEGSSIGTASSSFFQMFVKAKGKKDNPVAELKKMTGVDLNIFDKKGKFLGLENAIGEFNKLKGKLSDEQMISFGSELAGEEGASIFSAMVQKGDEFKAFNTDVNQSVGLMDKAAKESENLSNKYEALTGSLQNLGAAGFKPLVQPLSWLTDKANDATGYLTKLATAYPTTAGTTAGILALGSAALTLKGGSSLLSRFTGSAGNLAAFGAAAEGSASKVGKLKGSLLSVPNLIKVGLLVETIGFTWEQIDKFSSVLKEYKKTQGGLDSVGGENAKSWALTKQQAANNGQAPDYNSKANDLTGFLQEGKNRQLEYALDPKRMGWYDWIYTLGGALSNPFYKNAPTTGDVMSKPEYRERIDRYKALGAKGRGNYSDVYTRVGYEAAGAANLQRRAPELGNDANLMTAFRQQVSQQLNFSAEMKSSFENMLQLAFPKSFAQSSQLLAEQSGQLNNAFLALQQPTMDVGNNFLNLSNQATPLGLALNNTQTATNDAAVGVNNLANAANSAAVRLSSIQISPIQIPMAGGAPPARALGGRVKRGDPTLIGERGAELFVPGASGSVVSNNGLRQLAATPSGSAAARSNVSFKVSINVSDSGDAKQTALEIRRELTTLAAEWREEMQPKRVARRVAYAAERDYELT